MNSTSVEAPAPLSPGALLAKPSQLGPHRELRERSSVLAMFREIIHDYGHYRYLLYQLTLRDIKIRYKQAVMGLLWAVLTPVMVVAAGLLIKIAMGELTGTGASGEAMAGLAIKGLAWAFFVGAIQFSTSSLVGNMSLVTKIYFPREVLPVSSVLAQLFDTAVGAMALLLLLPWLGVHWSANLLWVPVLWLVLIVYTTAIAIFLSAANLFYRDIKYLVQVAVTFGIFFTPVFYEPSVFGPAGAHLIMLNPLAPILEGLRLAVVEGHGLLNPISDPASGALLWEPWYLAYAAVLAGVGFLASALIFHRAEIAFAEYA